MNAISQNPKPCGGTGQNYGSSTNRVSARNNPFAVQRTDAIPFDFSETPFEDIASFYRHAKAFNFRGAIRGRHGNGKTTLLCDLSRYLKDQEIDCELALLPRETKLQQQAVEKLTRRGIDGAIILVDGIERLPFIDRLRLIPRSKSFAGFIATTHYIGRLRTLVRCGTSEQTLMAILRSLNMDQADVVAAGKPLVSKHRGNLRSVLRELYDQFADGKIG